MIMRFLLSFFVVFLLGFSREAVCAEWMGDDGTLHVLRAVVHAEQDQPELCLEFDHSLLEENHKKITATVRLESEGKPISASSKAISVFENTLCVPVPQHRKNYRLTLTGLRGAEGRQLTAPYSLSFNVPARRPNLAFVNNAANRGMMRWRGDENPVLRAINVQQAKIELFRLTDPARMVEAWAQRMQTILAPSESATFARANGTLIWQGAVAFDATAVDSNSQKQAINFEAAGTEALSSLPQGLYLIVASAPDLRQKETDLAPVAAAWLLRSDLRIHVMQSHDEFRLFADHLGANTPMPATHFLLMDSEQKTLQDSMGGADGVAALVWPKDRQSQAHGLIAIASSGDVDFWDPQQQSQDGADDITLPSRQASIRLERDFYAPMEKITVDLLTQDFSGTPSSIPSSQLQVLYPDGHVYGVLPIAGVSNGYAQTALTAPVENGLWKLVWRQDNGQILAEKSLRISTNPNAPMLESSVDRAMIAADSVVVVTIKSRTFSGQPAPYMSGNISTTWTATDHIFSGWSGYHFGVRDSDNLPVAPRSQTTPFMTDGRGIAHVSLRTASPTDASVLHAVTIVVRGDSATGAMDPPTLQIPVKPQDLSVGLRATKPNGRFPENGFARFDVVALDRDGHRMDDVDLTYQIYEQGRNFDWYQSEGRWDYKALQQQRRIGGGPVPMTITSNGARRIEWPVTAGLYRIELTDADGDRVAAMDFSAGWTTQTTAPAFVTDLAQLPLHMIDATHVRLSLSQPSYVAMVVADDRIRQTLHGFYAAGDHVLALAKSEDWGRQFRLHVEARTADDETAEPYAVGDLTYPPHTPIASAPRATKNRGASVSVSESDKAVEKMTVLKGVKSVLAPDQATELSFSASMGKSLSKKKMGQGGKRFVIVGRDETLASLPLRLQNLFNQPVVTTAALAMQLKNLQVWRDELVGFNLATESDISQRQRETLQRLLSRQQKDGGFSVDPTGSSMNGDGMANDYGSDLVSTATAVTAMVRIAQPVVVSIPLQRAVAWLTRTLDNTWFDESERPARAVAYAALAEAQAINESNLRYFADASLSKNLPNYAAAALASAFRKMNDSKLATLWLAVSQAAQPTTTLSNNAEALISEAESLSALWDVWDHQNRMGSWRIAVNGVEQKSTAVRLIPLSDKAGTTMLRNLSDQPLYVTDITILKHSGVRPESSGAGGDQSSGDDLISRHIYRPDGGEIRNGFVRGHTYVVVAEGLWPAHAAGQDLAVIRETPDHALLRPISCALGDGGGDSALIWLPERSSVRFCEKTGNSLILQLQQKKQSKPPSRWRIAYLVQAE